MHNEAGVENKMQMVKDSLFNFVKAHVSDANLGAVDDIIVSYVLATIDAVMETPEDFCMHANELMEILSAYVVDFAKIANDTVYLWLMALMATLSEAKRKAQAATKQGKDTLTFYIPKDTTKPPSNNTSRSNSTSEDDSQFPSKVPARKQVPGFDSADEDSKKQGAVQPNEPYEYAVLLKFLSEMFPDVPAMEIKHCVTIALGDVEGSLSTLMHRREHGLAHSVGALPARANKHVLIDSAAVKSRIIERYSYVDREAECKEHKPLAPKHAPKKMVRYRDNKIVSLKGERYTEVSKGEEEGVKKTNKKHHP